MGSGPLVGMVVDMSCCCCDETAISWDDGIVCAHDTLIGVCCEAN